MRWLVLAAVLIGSPVRAAERCLPYEPAVVELTGTLGREVFPGPPNYEDTTRGDRPEEGFYLHLARPICTGAAADEEPRTGVGLIQVLLAESAYATLTVPRGTDTVTLRGTLSGAVSGHHHAPLLLTLSSPGGTPQVLATFPAAGYRYQLTYDQPRVADRELHAITLIVRGARGETLDSLVMNFDRGSQYQPDRIDESYGVAGDTQAWTGDTSYGLAALPVNLGPAQAALLVTEKMGSEFPERHHYLYLARNGKLAQVWSSDDELPGGAWDVRVVSTAAPQALAMVSLDRPDFGKDVARLRAYRFRWDAAHARMVKTPLPAPDAPLSILYLGPYRTRDAALAAWPNDDTCGFRGDLLPGRLLPSLGLRGVLIARVYVSRDEARAAQNALAGCPRRHTPRYAEWR
jgi:hypothetical protein